MWKPLVEECQICSAFVPVDMQTAANNGDWISLKGWECIDLVLFKAAGTAGDDPVFTAKQAVDVSGTSAKALTFTTIYKKVGTLTAAAQGTFTKTTQSAANTYTDTDSAENQAIMVVSFRADDLDVDNGFDCVQLHIPDTGNNAQLGCGFYILRGPRYAGATLPSAIAD